MAGEPKLIRVRRVFEQLRITYSDTENVSRNNISIRCPWCGNDAGFHLSVNEESGKYRCWRNTWHRGNSFRELLYKIGHSREAVNTALRDNYEIASVVVAHAPATVAMDILWDRFHGITELGDEGCVPHIQYLESRGIPFAAVVAREYDLRYARTGRWAQRVLFPMAIDGHINGWTGRLLQVRGSAPKYIVSENTPNPLYLLDKCRGPSAIIVEGPFDALKLNVAMFPPDRVGAFSLAGKLSPGKADLIRKFSPQKLWLCLDSDTSLSEQKQSAALLRQLGKDVSIIRLPAPYKDVGEMPCDKIARTFNKTLGEFDGDNRNDSMDRCV